MATSDRADQSRETLTKDEKIDDLEFQIEQLKQQLNRKNIMLDYTEIQKTELEDKMNEKIKRVELENTNLKGVVSDLEHRISTKIDNTFTRMF